MRFGKLALAAVLLVGAAQAQAQTVFSQLPDTVSGYYSSIPSVQAADDFTLSSSNFVTGLHWWGAFQTSTFPNNFTLRLFNDNGSGSPTVTPFATLGYTNLTVTDTGQAEIGLTTATNILYYTADLTTPFAALGGTKYHLSILNGTTNNWIWQDQDRTNSASIRNGDGNGWATSTIGNRAFELLGTPIVPVPEPGSIALLIGMGTVGAAYLRRRKVASKAA